jgi:mono/diheme cytochrome c family protein
MSMSFQRALVVCSIAMAVCASAQDQKKEVKHAPAPATSPASGSEMFNSYCASCHGKDAKGNGPAASALNAAPSDLTMLARKNGGKFPDLKVMAVLRGEAKVAAHGTQEMPVWGPVFWHMSQGHAAEVHQRVANLANYIKSMQEK